MANSRNRGDNTDYSDTVVGRNPDATPSPRLGEDHTTSLRDYHGNGSSYRPGDSNGRTLFYKDDHQGYFTNSNPYFEQLKAAEEGQDTDAMYSYAVQWEADYHNLQEQRAYNREVLEEQRQYDSPVNQIARARAAGINPDLDGSGGSTSSGSGAQMQIPAMADQSSNVNTQNTYDTANMIFSGINAAANFAGTLTTGVSSIMNAVSTMKMVPSQIALNEANAGLSDAKANEIQQLLHGKKQGQLIANEGANIQNIGAGIANATNTLAFLAEISNLIDPSADDEMLMPYLNSLGVPEQNQLYYKDIIKQMHANPQMRDKYAKAELSARWSEEQNAQYTDAVVAEMTDLQKNIDYEQQHWQYQTTNLKNKISAALNTDTFVDRTVSNEMDSLLLQGETLGIKRDEIALVSEQLKNDTKAYLNSLKDRAATLEEMDKTIAALEKSGKQTPYVKAQIDRVRAEKIALRGMLSSEFNQIKTHYLVTTQQLYNNYTLLDTANNVVNEGDRSKPNFFSDVTFNDLIYHTRTPGQIANQWVNTGISAAGVVVDAAGVARGFDFNTTYRDVHNNREFNRGQAIGYEKAKQKYGRQ